MANLHSPFSSMRAIVAAMVLAASAAFAFTYDLVIGVGRFCMRTFERVALAVPKSIAAGSMQARVLRVLSAVHTSMLTAAKMFKLRRLQRARPGPSNVWDMRLVA